MKRLLPAAILASFMLAGSGLVVLSNQPGQPRNVVARSASAVAPIEVDDDLVPPHLEPSPPPSPSPSPKPAPPKPSPKPKSQSPAKPTGDLVAYQGLGAWVDVYDYALRDNLDPSAAVDEMARHGVKTLFLQTGRYKEPADIVNSQKVDLFLEKAHAKGIKVVGWYLPGFGDLERDLRRSLLVLSYSTPTGHRFDGFAPDIESREEVGNDRLRFNAGIIEYSRRLRAAVPPGTVIGAIVVDAKNNERAPARWEGFPWPEIAIHYDVVLSMAYWSVTKKDCMTQYDVAAYMRDVIAKTEALMGSRKPVHPIGGIADCISGGETSAFVTALKQAGAIGGSLYDFQTTEKNPESEGIWAELGRLNQ
ncbi:MAG: hypothetical protein ABIS18_05835 [Actinomycetota bacterium]